MTPGVLVYLGMAASMGIAIKSAETGMYLNLKTLKLESLDKSRRSEYIFGYRWTADHPYGFGLDTETGHLDVDEHGALFLSADDKDLFGFHLVRPSNCKFMVVGHGGLCMADGGNGNIEFSKCLEPGKEPSRFHFVFKMFRKDRPDASWRVDQALKTADPAGTDLAGRIVDDIKALGNPGLEKNALREKVEEFLRNIRMQKGDDETEDTSEDGCREHEDIDDDTEDNEEPGCAVRAREAAKTDPRKLKKATKEIKRMKKAKRKIKKRAREESSERTESENARKSKTEETEPESESEKVQTESEETPPHPPKKPRAAERRREPEKTESDSEYYHSGNLQAGKRVFNRRFSLKALTRKVADSLVKEMLPKAR